MMGPGVAPPLSLLQAGCGGPGSVAQPGGCRRKSLGFRSCSTPRAASASPHSSGICSKKKCFSIALRHTLVVLEMH